MSFPKQKFREIVLQVLFSQGFTGLEEELASFLSEQLAVSKKIIFEAIEKSRAISSLIPEIDARVEGVSSSYDWSRISSVEKSILRLGVYELFHDTSLPPKVTIAEAIRLARKFSTPEGASFVNAILDSLFQGDKAVGSATTLSEK